ncbi:MAG: pyridoxine 5'-phosphate synthase [Ideonella sp.]
MNPLISTGIDGRPGQRGYTALSVNLNRVALLRNSRDIGIPDVCRAATLAIDAGANGITVHPRPDERHIRAADVFDLASLLGERPGVEYNVEGNPFHNLMDLLRQLASRGQCPQQVTFVPDSMDQATSDHGWLFPQDAQRLTPLIAEAKALGTRVSLFMDPTPESMAQVREVGADRVELYTEAYARSHGAPELAFVLAGYRASAEAALREGLGVNAGHDLNLDNLTDFLSAVPGVLEVSIGHALISDAIELGLAQTVRDYLRCIHLASA